VDSQPVEAEMQRFVVMVQRRGPDHPAEHEVHDVDEPALRPLWAEAIRAEPHGKDETLVQQILEHRRDMAAAVPTRLFAAGVDGKLVAHAELYSHDGVGQVEDVVTLEPYRGRGLARALVLRAAAESRAAGNDLTFLVADADDWPHRLYERLGFETVGRYGAVSAARLIAPKTNERGAWPRSLPLLSPKRYPLELLRVAASRSISEPPGFRRPGVARA
jgi:predicted GNAT family acetyltransferase